MENNNTTIKDNLLGHTNQNTIRRFLCCIFHKRQNNNTHDDNNDTDDDMDKYIPTWSINKGTLENNNHFDTTK